MGEGNQTLPVPASYGPVVQKIGQFYITEHDDSESNDDEYVSTQDDDGNVYTKLFEDENDEYV